MRKKRNMLTASIMVFLAHFLGDYPLQGEFLAQWKSKSRYILFVHSFIWAGLVYLALAAFGLDTYWKFLFLLFGHMVIDEWKCRTFSSPEDIQKTFGITINGMQAFFIDQSLHALQLLAVLAL
jgi:hypothetical protein